MNLGRALDLMYLNASTKLGLSVQSVLESGQSAMESGGAFANESAKIDQLGGGFYHILYKGCIFILLCVVVLAGLKLALSNTNDRQEAKSKLFWTGVGIVVVCSAAAIIVLFSDIGNGIFTDLGQ